MHHECVQHRAISACAGEVLTDVRQAFADEGAVQCGFCTPGVLVSAHALLSHNADPRTDEIRAGLSGNLCRCSGYRKIVEAVAEAAKEAKP